MRIVIEKHQRIRKEISTKAITSFVCGLISLSVIPILPAIIFGHLALLNIRKHNFNGKIFATIGLIFGYTFLVFYVLFSIVLYINLNTPAYQQKLSKQLLAIKEKIQATNWHQRKTFYKKNEINLEKIQNKTQGKNLYDNILDIEIAINKADKGNFIYGTGSAMLKSVVMKSGIDDNMPTYTLGSKNLTDNIEDAGFTPKTNYSIAGKNGIIDYFWKQIN